MLTPSRGLVYRCSKDILSRKHLEVPRCPRRGIQEGHEALHHLECTNPEP